MLCRNELPHCWVKIWGSAVKCYWGAGLMPLCLLESWLKCAGRLLGTVGDPSLGPGQALAQWWTESFFTFFHYLVSFWHNLHTISGLKSPFWASQIRCAQNHLYMGEIQPIATPIALNLAWLITSKYGNSWHPSNLHTWQILMICLQHGL